MLRRLNKRQDSLGDGETAVKCAVGCNNLTLYGVHRISSALLLGVYHVHGQTHINERAT